MKNFSLLADYSLNVLLEGVFFRGFFVFFWSIWWRSDLEQDFSLESNTGLIRKAAPLFLGELSRLYGVVYILLF